MDDFNSSIDIDKRLIQEDISVTRAHVDALFKLGVINKSDLSKINKGLTSIQNDFDQKKIKFTKKNEDIHMNIEFFLHQKIGDTALKLHTGRSRNDQVITDFKIWITSETTKIDKNLSNIIKTILNFVFFLLQNIC